VHTPNVIQFLQADNVLVLTNENSGSQQSNDAISLHSTDAVSKRDLVSPIDWLLEQELQGVALDRSFMIIKLVIPPDVLASINITHDKTPSGIDYSVNFQSTSSTWKYFVMGEFATKPLEIIPKKRKPNSNEANNNSSSEENLTDGVLFQVLDGSKTDALNRPLLIFKSNQPLPLKERSDFAFQLREKGTGKVLIKRLPVASAAQLQGQLVNGVFSAESDIYINY